MMWQRGWTQCSDQCHSQWVSDHQVMIPLPAQVHDGNGNEPQLPLQMLWLILMTQDTSYQKSLPVRNPESPSEGIRVAPRVLEPHGPLPRTPTHPQTPWCVGCWRTKSWSRHLRLAPRHNSLQNHALGNTSESSTTTPGHSLLAVIPFSTSWLAVKQEWSMVKYNIN